MVVLLLPNCCFLSESSRMLELHRELVRRGVPVVSATHGGSFARVYDDAGVDLLRLGSVALERERHLVASVPGMRGAPADMWGEEELTQQVRRELELIERVGPHVIVTGWTLSALISSKVSGVPLVTEHAGSMLPPLWENDLLPLPSTLPSPVLGLLPRSVATRGFNRRTPRLKIHIGAVNRVCEAFGVEPLPSFPALLMGDLSLVMDVPEMFGFSRAEVDAWQPRHPEAYRTGSRLAYGGPLFARLALPVPDRVEAFLDRGPVYVAMTSTPPRLMRRVVDNLRGLGRPLLVSSGGYDLSDLDGPDLMVEPLLPNHLVVPRVALMVAAGGHGSLQTAVAAGTPFLGIPLQPEQDTNVVLAERRGVAHRVGPRDATTPALVAVARRMLSDPAYREAAQRMAEAYAAVDGAAATAEAVVGFAAIDAPVSRQTDPNGTP